MTHTNRLLKRSTAPASEPVTLSEAKLYLRVDGNNEDALIADLIVAARIHAEQWLRRSLITQAWCMVVDKTACSTLALPMGPVIAITAVTSRASDGTGTVLLPAAYQLNAAKNEVALLSLPAGQTLEVMYSAGYGDASAVPKPIKLGMLAHIAAMYDNRGEGAVPAQATGFYTPFRELRL